MIPTRGRSSWESGLIHLAESFPPRTVNSPPPFSGAPSEGGWLSRTDGGKRVALCTKAAATENGCSFFSANALLAEWKRRPRVVRAVTARTPLRFSSAFRKPGVSISGVECVLDSVVISLESRRPPPDRFRLIANIETRQDREREKHRVVLSSSKCRRIAVVDNVYPFLTAHAKRYGILVRVLPFTRCFQLIQPVSQKRFT